MMISRCLLAGCLFLTVAGAVAANAASNPNAEPATPEAVDPAETLVNEAADLIDQKRPAEALPLLEKAIALEEQSYAGEQRQIFSSRSTTETLFYTLRGTTSKKDTIVIGPNWGTAEFLKGFVLIDLGRSDEAKPHFEKAIALSPMNGQYLGELGEWYKMRKDWEQAYDLFERASSAADFAPDDESKSFERRRGLRGMGFVLIEQGKLDKAEKAFRECLEIDPNDAGAQNELAYIKAQRAKATTY